MDAGNEKIRQKRIIVNCIFSRSLSPLLHRANINHTLCMCFRACAFSFFGEGRGGRDELATI